MNLTANETAGWTWPEVILVLGLIFLAVTLLFGAAAAWIEVRRTKLLAQQEDNLRQLVSRYEQLAENTHDLWAAQRIAQGWTFGPNRDDANQKHPCLIPYADLPDSEKIYDRQAAIETLKAILALGYRIEQP